MVGTSKSYPQIMLIPSGRCLPPPSGTSLVMMSVSSPQNRPRAFACGPPWALVLPLGSLLLLFGSGLARGEGAPEPSAVRSPESAGFRDDLLREFKKYFRKYKDSASRVEAVLALEDQTDPQVVRVLEPILGDKDPAVVTAGVRVLAGLTHPACQAAIIELLASSKKEPVRLGILRVLAFGALSHDGAAVRECLADRSWQVRRARPDGPGGLESAGVHCRSGSSLQGQGGGGALCRPRWIGPDECG